MLTTDLYLLTYCFKHDNQEEIKELTFENWDNLTDYTFDALEPEELNTAQWCIITVQEIGRTEPEKMGENQPC